MYFTEHTFQINVKYTYNNLVLQKLVVHVHVVFQYLASLVALDPKHMKNQM